MSYPKQKQQYHVTNYLPIITSGKLEKCFTQLLLSQYSPGKKKEQTNKRKEGALNYDIAKVHLPLTTVNLTSLLAAPRRLIAVH